MTSRDAEPVRITTARTSVGADRAMRQRRYLVSMAIRTVCFLGAVAVGPGILRWVLIAGAALLPYLAVVLANSDDRRDDGFGLFPHPSSHELGGPNTRK